MMNGNTPEVMQSLVYAIHDGVSLAGDLYVPDGPGPHRVLLGIAGGGWRVGHRSAFAGWGRYLAARGYALFAIDHRKTTEAAMFPQAVQDVMAALRFLSGAPAALRIDARDIVLIGSSAGAHLAAMAALAGGQTWYAAPDAASPGAALIPAIRGMILVYGVYDLVAQWQHGRDVDPADGEDRVARFLGASPYDDPDLYHRASPLRQITYAQNHIASMIIWGDADTVVPATQSQRFSLALQQARFYVRDCVVQGAGHFWFTDDPIDDQQGFAAFVAPRIVRFLNQLFPARPFHQEG